MRGFRLYFGAFGGAAFGWQKVKTLGRLPSKNNKLRNEGIAAWSRVPSSSKWTNLYSAKRRIAQNANIGLAELLANVATPGNGKATENWVFILDQIARGIFARGHRYSISELGVTLDVQELARGAPAGTTPIATTLNPWLTGLNALYEARGLGVPSTDSAPSPMQPMSVLNAAPNSFIPPTDPELVTYNNDFIAKINANIDSHATLATNTEEQNKRRNERVKEISDFLKRNDACFTMTNVAGVNQVAVDPTALATALAALTPAEQTAKLMAMNASLAIAAHDVESGLVPLSGIIHEAQGPEQTLLISGLSELDALKKAGQWNETDLLCETFNGDYEPQPTNLLRTLDVSANLMAIFDLSDMFKMGLSMSVGYSFRELELKDTPITINESLMAKLALVIGITEYVQLHLGAGVVKRDVGIKKYDDWNQDYSNAKNMIENRVMERFGAGPSNQGINPDDTCDHLALFGFVELMLKYPINENFDFCIKIGAQRDFNDFDGDLGGVGTNLQMNQLAHGTLGIGILFKA